MEWEKIFANHTCNKGSISKYIKNLYIKISKKKIKQPDQKQIDALDGYFIFKEDI